MMRDGVRILVLIAVAFVLVLGGCKKEPEPGEPAVVGELEPEVEVPEVVEEAVETAEQAVEEVAEEVTEKAAEVAPQENLAVPLVGVGKVKFGMSVADVIGVLGEPEREEGSGVGMYYLSSNGMHIATEPRKGVWQIHCWSADYPIPAPEAITTFAGKTDKGIAMGAGRAEIVAAYGEPDSDETKKSLQVLGYNELKMQFELSEGKLVHIALTAP